MLMVSSRDDWEIEAGRMFSIYADAALTIAATSSPGADHGFLGPRHRRIGKQISVAYQNSVIPVNVREAVYHEEWDSADWNPLYTRAWAFQELLISPRLISFGAAEVEWYCADRSWCECDKTAESWWKPHYELLRRQRATVNLLNIGDGRPAVSPIYRAEISGFWELMVEEYTKRQLTFSSDKLPALSGLATKFAKALQLPESDYLAGLWRSDLLNGIAWQCASKAPKIGTPSPGYRAPSWSWASVDTSIYYGNKRLLKRPIPTKITHASASLSGRNRFGEVSHGILGISGPAAHAEFSLPAYDADGWRSYDPEDVNIRWLSSGYLSQSSKRSFQRRRGQGGSFRPDLPLVEGSYAFGRKDGRSLRRCTVVSPLPAAGVISGHVVCLLVAHLDYSRHFNPECLLLLVLGRLEGVLPGGNQGIDGYERLGLLTVEGRMIKSFYSRAKTIDMYIV